MSLQTIRIPGARRAPTWREIALDFANEIVDRKPRHEWTHKELRKALRDGYPFGERKMWPYKVWLKVSKDMVRTVCGPEIKEQPVDFGLFKEQADG